MLRLGYVHMRVTDLEEAERHYGYTMGLLPQWPCVRAVKRVIVWAFPQVEAVPVGGHRVLITSRDTLAALPAARLLDLHVLEVRAPRPARCR